ncbi:hypothetical protein [Marinobacter similis]|uniref:hypothetical protein n=1 Tax=Marinobacter similis TaxID=1420916 RepID=UPI000AD573A7|nr:hypothetical protein [Marinobacter similis]
MDVIVTYWHFAARLQGEGSWRSAFAMSALLTELDLDRNLPVLGYVFPANWAEDHGLLIDGFAASLDQPKLNWRKVTPPAALAPSDEQSGGRCFLGIARGLCCRYSSAADRPAHR